MGEILSWATTIVLVVAIIVGGSVYGCTKLNDRYYDAVNQCSQSGGTWVPGMSYSGTCVQARSR